MQGGVLVERRRGAEYPRAVTAEVAAKAGAVFTGPGVGGW